MLDQIVSRPVIAWAEKFKVEQVESAEVPRSWVLNLLQHSRALAQLEQKAIFPLRESLMSYFSRKHNIGTATRAPRWKTYVLGTLGVAGLGLTGYAVVRVAILLTGLDHSEVTELGQGLGATFLRVIAALLIRCRVDHPRRREDWFQSALGPRRAAVGTDCCVSSGQCFFSCYFADLISARRRPRHRFHFAAFAGNAVVHPLQRDRRRDGDSHRSERSLHRMPDQWLATLAKAHPSGGIFPYLLPDVIIVISGGTIAGRRISI